VRGLGRLAGVAAAVALCPAPIGAQSAGEPPRASVAPAFSGRYKLVLTASRDCPASMQVGPLSVAVDVTEAPVAGGSEVSGRSASPSEIPGNGRFVLLRQGDRLHGASGASSLELGLRTEEGYRVWMQIMTDGTVATSSGGSARATGTAFGEIEISLASDPSGDPIGSCPFALGHTWSLEPI
jgi:hypothetical protein